MKFRMESAFDLGSRGQEDVRHDGNAAICTLSLARAKELMKCSKASPSRGNVWRPNSIRMDHFRAFIHRDISVVFRHFIDRGKTANKAPEPTPTSVMPRANERRIE